jgi:hypothetical protein
VETRVSTENWIPIYSNKDLLSDQINRLKLIAIGVKRGAFGVLEPAFDCKKAFLSRPTISPRQENSDRIKRMDLLAKFSQVKSFQIFQNRLMLAPAGKGEA